MWVDRDGTAREIDPEWRVAINSGPALSPDGTRLALSILDYEGGSEVRVKQLDTGPFSRITLDGGFSATWSPDDQLLTFLSNRAGNNDVWTRRADGSDSAELVLDRELGIQEALYHPEGTWWVFREGGRAADISAVQLSMDSAAVALEVSEFSERGIALSPDGRWLAFVSNRNGPDEVWVRPFPEAGSLRQVSVDG